MKKEKLPLLFHLNNNKKGQIIFLTIGLILILFVFLVIILGNLSSNYLQFSDIFRNYVSLRSLSVSGLRYVLYKINQDPNFTTISETVSMPQGYFNYSVSDIASNTKKVNIQVNLRKGLSRIIKATVTIDSLGKILDIDVSEE